MQAMCFHFQRENIVGFGAFWHSRNLACVKCKQGNGGSLLLKSTLETCADLRGGGGEISKIFINFYLLTNVINSIKIWNALN